MLHTTYNPRNEEVDELVQGDVDGGEPELGAGDDVTRGRVGVLVPPENPTVEPEMAALLGPSVALHVARLRLTRDTDLRVRLQTYRTHLSETLGQFGKLALDRIFIACTGAFYDLGPEADERLCDQLSEERGVPVLTATRAIAERLDHEICRTAAIVSPYPAWLTEASRAYWTAAGLEIVETVEMSGGRPIYTIGAQDIADSLAAVAQRVSGVDVILVTGTGVPTATAIAALQPRVGPKLLSSNLCGALWLTQPSPSSIQARA